MNKWDYRFIDLARLVSTWSKDSSTKCGAVIVRPDKSIASAGFNGFPKGTDDSSELYDNRELKLERVIHAELNAILLSNEDLEGYTIYTWPAAPGPSCSRCSAHIIQAGIKRVVHVLPHELKDFSDRWKESTEIGLKLFDEANVRVDSYTDEEWVVAVHAIYGIKR